MADIEKQIADLAKSIELKRQRLKDLEQRKKTISRSNETRRKIIIGAAVLAGLKNKTPEDQDRSMRWIHCHVVNRRDREFLGLAPLVRPPRESEESSGSRS